MTDDAPEQTLSELPADNDSSDKIGSDRYTPETELAKTSFKLPVDDANPKGFTSVGQLIRRRTTDFLAIAIIGFGLFTISGQLVDWWKTEPDELTNPVLTANDLVGLQSMWGSDGSPVTLDFGDSPYSVRKHFIRGKAEDAVEYLVSESKAIVNRPLDGLPPATDAETRLIKLVNKVQPVDSGDSWAIYRIDYPSTMVVGVRELPHEIAEDPSSVRVVCWGIMLSVRDQWSLFMIEPAPTSADHSSPFLISLPPNSRRTMSLRDERGAFVMGVMGKGDVRSWADHYHQEFTSHDWPIESQWRHEETRSTARYAIKSSGQSTHWIDIQLTNAASDRCSGLIVFTPVPSE